MITQKRKREILINSLRQLWEYSNNTAYYAVFRQQKKADMINKISYYLEDSKGIIGEREIYILNSLIRIAAALMVERTKENKRKAKRQLEILEEYYNKQGGKL